MKKDDIRIVVDSYAFNRTIKGLFHKLFLFIVVEKQKESKVVDGIVSSKQPYIVHGIFNRLLEIYFECFVQHT